MAQLAADGITNGIRLIAEYPIGAAITAACIILLIVAYREIKNQY